MNLLFSCIGKRGYIADYFRPHLHSGDKIFGTSHTPWTPGFQACDQGLLMPPIASDEYVPAILEVCRKYEITGLLSFFDPDVVALSAHVEELKTAGVIPLIPAEKAAMISFDKWQTFQTLRVAGFSVPDTTIDLEEARSGLRSGRFRFPLMVKPRTGFGSANVFVAGNDPQMEAFFSSKSPDREKIERYHEARVKTMAARVVKSVIETRYPNHSKVVAMRPAAASPAAPAAAAAPASSKPVFVTAKPAWEQLDMDKDPQRMLFASGRGYRKSDGKFITWNPKFK